MSFSSYNCLNDKSLLIRLKKSALLMTINSADSILSNKQTDILKMKIKSK